MRNKEESKPADMHSDGVHFDKNILESKRNESARAGKSDDDTSDHLENVENFSKSSSKKNQEELTQQRKENAGKKSKDEIAEHIEGGYNRDAPINDDKSIKSKD